MNYCYDVLINISEDNVFNFYEWEDFDPIELVKKIPLYRINSSVLKDFYSCDIKVDKEFLNEIMDKTILKNSKINKTIKYACLLCDCKNALVVEFNDFGEIVGRSNLLLEDESNIIEFIYSYNEIKIKYEKLKNREIKNFLRQEDLIKKVIKLELTSLVENKNYTKLKYLFNEWFGYEESSIDKIKNKIIKELSMSIDNNSFKVYNIIKDSYNNV